MKHKAIQVPVCILLLFFCQWVLAQQEEPFDMIYPANGPSIPCLIAEVAGAEIKYKPVENLQGPIYTKLKQDVVLLFKKDGEFMIPASSPDWTMGTDPTAHKIITREGLIFPAKFVETREDKVNYEDARNNKGYQLNKGEVLVVIYKDGGHEMFAEVSKVAAALAKMKSDLNHYHESKTASVPTAEGGIHLSDEQLEFFKEKAMQKAKDLGDYLRIISDKTEVEEDRLYAVGAAIKLFINDSAKVEVSSVNREQKKQYPIGVYLDRLRKLPYDKVLLEWIKAEFVSTFRKGEDGAYYGTITAQQMFRGISEGKIAYQDVTEKNVEVKLTRHKVIDDGKTKEKWEVFLSDISVNQTREK